MSVLVCVSVDALAISIDLWQPVDLPTPATNLIRIRTAMSLTPVAWRHPFPLAEGTTERVRIFEAEQICCFIQLQDRVREVIPRHLIPGVIQNPLKTGA